jgi:hypothetical protein
MSWIVKTDRLVIEKLKKSGIPERALKKILVDVNKKLLLNPPFGDHQILYPVRCSYVESQYTDEFGVGYLISIYYFDRELKGEKVRGIGDAWVAVID